MKHPTKIATCLALMLLLTQGPRPADADEAAEPAAPPDWYLAEIAQLTAGTGRWVTDNSAYRSGEEVFDAYATKWIAEFGGTTMSGRLFGFVDGRETANFWEFRQYWHPGRREVIVEQFGFGNTIGVGTQWQENGITKSDQVFYYANGTSSQTGHESHFPTADSYVTKSFDIVDGRWLPRREYTWHRDPGMKSDSESASADTL